MNSTTRADRLHIGIFGKRNAGKSSLINAITGQDTALVSKIAGTTTDPVYKSMEISPIGPIVIIDTPGIDDTGDLGSMRVKKTKEILRKVDIAIIVVSHDAPWDKNEYDLSSALSKANIPYIIAINKWDENKEYKIPEHIPKVPTIYTSAKNNYGIQKLISEICKLKSPDDNMMHLVDGLIDTGDTAILVVPIDNAAPKGRLILPQQQVIRDILDHNAYAIITKPDGLKDILQSLKASPNVVITDSQAFSYVDKIVPSSIFLTSFSILFARYKGDLRLFYEGIKSIDNLKDGDCILISEGCTHHRQDDDIGKVKIPNMLLKKTGKKLKFKHTSGGFFEEDISSYALIVHCGACMLNKKEMEYRQSLASREDIPMVNYGMVLAYGTGILKRALKPFEDEIL